jgi:hypothetical protein
VKRLLALALACAGCREPVAVPTGTAALPTASTTVPPASLAAEATSTPTAIPTASVAAESTATATSAAATPPLQGPPATALPIREALALEPGGPLALAPASENVVDAATTFRVEVPIALDDLRLVLVDAQDALVPASATREIGAVTHLALSPTRPLVPASRYVLRVEGAAGREARDAHGAVYLPAAFPLIVAGDPPPPPPAPKRRTRR